MRLYFKFFAMHLKSRMAYKKSFFMSALGQFLISFTIFLWMWFLLERFETIAGYTLAECLVCSGVMLSAYALAEGIFRGFDSFSSIVKSAAFDRILLRPRSLVFQVLCEKIELSRVGRLVQAGVMLAWGVAGLPVPFTPYRALALVLMILGGVVVFCALNILRAGFCFFTLEGLEFMNVFTDGARDYGAYPIDVYGRGTLKFCTYVVPYALFQYYPLRWLVGRSDNALLALLSLLTPLFLVPCLAVWRLGVSRYKSAGS